MFYERLLLICKEKNEKITPLVKKLGYSTGSLTNWQRGTIPSGDIVKTFAEYFDVSTDYLLGREEKHEITDSQLMFALTGKYDIGDDEVVADIKAAASAAAQAIAERRKK